MQFKVGQKVQFLGDICTTAKKGSIVTITNITTNEYFTFNYEGQVCSHYSGDFKPLKKTWDTLEVGDILVYKYNTTSDCKVLAIIGEIVAMNFSSGVAWRILANLKNDWTIKEADTTQELTLDDIAKKFDIPLDQLRIKDK